MIFVDASPDERVHSRNCCVFADGEVDRSPTGTGVSARLALHHARGELVVGEKIMAQGVPVVGAVGGATINLLFIDHFQDMARGHFIVRRLERSHGETEVRKRYQVLARNR